MQQVGPGGRVSSKFPSDAAPAARELHSLREAGLGRPHATFQGKAWPRTGSWGNLRAPERLERVLLSLRPGHARRSVRIV